MTDKIPIIGFVGCGKLGLPLAVAIASKGYKVLGYDVNPALMKKRKYEHRELGPTLEDDFQKHFDEADLTFLPLEDLMAQADIVFVAVQTPHESRFEGTTRLPEDRADFDYSFLKESCSRIAPLKREGQIISVVSTVLPGTMRREILPIIPDCGYTPAFPAMGTCVADFLYPEFALLGSDDEETTQALYDFYHTFYHRLVPIASVSIESAELAKVAYNLLISLKITAITAFQQIAHNTPGCNIQEVSFVLSMATRRVCSAAYLQAGTQDGGACHPRDMIAMAHKCRELGIQPNLFDSIAEARELQVEWLAEEFLNHAEEAGLSKLVLLGKSYKPESSITTGSSAILLANILEDWGIKFEHYDPYIEKIPEKVLIEKAAFLICVNHWDFLYYKFPKGSLVVDPFGSICRPANPSEDIQIVSIGMGK